MDARASTSSAQPNVDHKSNCDVSSTLINIQALSQE